jgi:hypothetical protein
VKLNQLVEINKSQEDWNLKQEKGQHNNPNGKQSILTMDCQVEGITNGLSPLRSQGEREI